MPGQGLGEVEGRRHPHGGKGRLPTRWTRRVALQHVVVKHARRMGCATLGQGRGGPGEGPGSGGGAGGRDDEMMMMMFDDEDDGASPTKDFGVHI